MNNWTFAIIIIAWVFQAGVNYAGFLILKSQMAAALAWQLEHGKSDDNRFMLVIGMFATYVPDGGRDKIMELIKEFTKQ